jgi:hypothetical protein
MDISSTRALARPHRRRERRDRRKDEVARRRRRVGSERPDLELHDLTSRAGVCDIEAVGRLFPRLAAAEGFVRADIAKDVVAGLDVREVDDQVRPLREAHQKAVAVRRGEVDRSCEKAALVPDLPHLDTFDVVEVENEEA